MKYSVSIMYTMHLGLLDKSRLSKLPYSLYCVHVLSQLSLISFFRITDRELPFDQILACDQLRAMPISVQMIIWLVMQGLVHFVKSHVRWVHAPLRKYIRRDERYCHSRSIYRWFSAMQDCSISITANTKKGSEVGWNTLNGRSQPGIHCWGHQSQSLQLTWRSDLSRLISWHQISKQAAVTWLQWGVPL